MLAFLDKYILEDAMDEDITLPEFTQEIIGHLTDAYDADVALIKSMPGVEFIDP